MRMKVSPRVSEALPKACVKQAAFRRYRVSPGRDQRGDAPESTLAHPEIARCKLSP